MHQMPPGLTTDIQVAQDGVVLLGSPGGSATFIHTTLHQSVTETEEFFKQLDQLQDSYHIARFCMSS